MLPTSDPARLGAPPSAVARINTTAATGAPRATCRCRELLSRRALPSRTCSRGQVGQRLEVVDHPAGRAPPPAPRSCPVGGLPCGPRSTCRAAPARRPCTTMRFGSRYSTTAGRPSSSRVSPGSGGGGNTLDLVKHVLLRDEANAIQWLRGQGLIDSPRHDRENAVGAAARRERVNRWRGRLRSQRMVDSCRQCRPLRTLARACI